MGALVSVVRPLHMYGGLRRQTKAATIFALSKKKKKKNVGTALLSMKVLWDIYEAKTKTKQNKTKNHAKSNS